jgi:hypothetical protein
MPAALNPAWEQAANRGTDHGSFTLVINSKGAAAMGAGIATWDSPHGTLDVTLVPADGAAGSNVTAHATF